VVQVFAGELLSLAANLIHSGLNTNDIVSGYQKGLKQALEILEGTRGRALPVRRWMRGANR
jgi:chaperonin GroEL (HSP60 family)